MLKKTMNLSIYLFLLSLLIISCNKEPQKPLNKSNSSYSDSSYTIVGNKIYHRNKAIQLIGVNAFHVFGAGGNDMNRWKIDISREFVGNTKEVWLTGYPFKDSNGSYLHSLQSVVDSNRANNRITILCPFQWNGLPTTDFTGKMPKETYWWSDFKLKLQN
jgi:mannan endo-1,4-beta-mannosidase